MTVPLVNFTREGVQPPSRFYLRPSERIEVVAWCSVAGVVLGIHGLILTPAGVVQEISEALRPTADRAASPVLFPISEGFLLHLQIRVESGAVLPGECFVTAHIVRGLAGAAVRVSTLLADYVTPMVSPTYPVSSINQSTASPSSTILFTGADPAAGAEAVVTVPTNAIWSLHSLRITLITAGGGAAREVRFLINDGVTTLLISPSFTSQGAGLTRQYNFFNQPTNLVISNTDIFGHIPPLRLLPGWRIQTDTLNFAGGDDFGPPFICITEWLIE